MIVIFTIGRTTMEARRNTISHLMQCSPVCPTAYSQLQKVVYNQTKVLQLDNRFSISSQWRGSGWEPDIPSCGVFMLSCTCVGFLASSHSPKQLRLTGDSESSLHERYTADESSYVSPFSPWFTNIDDGWISKFLQVVHKSMWSPKSSEYGQYSPITLL